MRTLLVLDALKMALDTRQHGADRRWLTIPTPVRSPGSIDPRNSASRGDCTSGE
jgi:hypothetical protein